MINIYHIFDLTGFGAIALLSICCLPSAARGAFGPPTAFARWFECVRFLILIADILGLAFLAFHRPWDDRISAVLMTTGLLVIAFLLFVIGVAFLRLSNRIITKCPSFFRGIICDDAREDLELALCDVERQRRELEAKGKRAFFFVLQEKMVAYLALAVTIFRTNIFARRRGK